MTDTEKFKECDSFRKKMIERIKSLMKEKKMTQDDLADKLSLERDSVGRWLRGESVEKMMPLPSAYYIFKLCEIFDCESGYLLGEYNCKHKENADIQKEIGLSEEAIDTLINLQKEKKKNNEYGCSYEIAEQDMLNYLLFDNKGLELLKNISLYCLSNYKCQNLRGRERDFNEYFQLYSQYNNSGTSTPFNFMEIPNLLKTKIKTRIDYLIEQIKEEHEN